MSDQHSKFARLALQEAHDQIVSIAHGVPPSVFTCELVGDVILAKYFSDPQKNKEISFTCEITSPTPATNTQKATFVFKFNSESIKRTYKWIGRSATVVKFLILMKSEYWHHSLEARSLTIAD
jgi:hypothetical protein